MKVSIIITCYNRQKFIARAIRSAISQRFPRDDFEVIVVDDGSTDSSRAVITDFGEEVVSIFHDGNKGLPAARNTGIRKAKGRFVMHLDSDDYMHEDLLYIEEMHLAFNPEWGAVACDYYEVDEDEQHLERYSAMKDPIACGIMFRKENLIDVGLYDERMLLCEDEELRIRYEEKFEIGNVHLPLYRYTKHHHNITKNADLMCEFRQKLSAIKESRRKQKGQ
ncbi:glycosyltransferase family 2 protein [Aestuariispira insulae]|uniref:Glycosyltransferase involved in cell wall biosynthesis n=1 Tax=Aestuariispira insulae TaxID=1461337 RepID=A0A3D9H4B6_9PROT|nr:glycosyltransferase family A protein [Aestuariispira insulae]RED44299.1 glycosyltransferase involved in cell wall biosynthesis [Aestuariispira insulae]